MATSPSDTTAAPSSPSQSGELSSGGHALAWESWGAEAHPAVVLLHHGLGSIAAWRAQLPALAAAGYRAVAYDRWGYGRSQERPSLDIPGFEADLQDLHGLVETLGLARPALIGHSDGGTIALLYAARFPAQVRAAIVVAAHIYLEPSMVPGIEGVRQAFETDLRFRHGLERVHGDKFEAVFNNWYRGWVRMENAGWDMRPTLRRVACPVLVVQGKLDEHATPRHAQDLAAALPASELWLVPGASHMLPQEKPDDFNRRVLAFLSQSRLRVESPALHSASG